MCAGRTKEQEPKEKKALTKFWFKTFTLHSVDAVADNTNRYRFKLPNSEHVSGIKPGNCVMVRAKVEGKTVPVWREYTPVTHKSEKGFIDLVVKKYPDGIMSKHIHTLQPGDSLQFSGPLVTFNYTTNMKKKIGMITGGVAITPMFQLIRHIMADPLDETEISLIYANSSENDIVLRDELNEFHETHPRFNVFYTLSKPADEWEGGRGRVTKEMIEEHLPSKDEDCLILVCGPEGLMESVAGKRGKFMRKHPFMKRRNFGGILKDLGYSAEQVHKF